MRTGSVRVGRDATNVINPLTEALVNDRLQRLRAEAERPRPAATRVQVGALLVRAGVRLGGPRTILLSGAGAPAVSSRS